MLDASATWPQKLRWPELARYAAVVGPENGLARARPRLEAALRKLADNVGEPVRIPGGSSREELAALALRQWAVPMINRPKKEDAQ